MRIAALQFAILLIGGSSAAAAADDKIPPANHICQAQQLEILSCHTSLRRAFGICLDKATLRMSFARQSGHHPVSVSPLSDVKEATLIENAHGNAVVLTATESVRSIALFVAGDYYDMESPILVTQAGGHAQTEFCMADTVVEDSAMLKAGNHEMSTGLFSLETDGIASTLPYPLAWPKPPGHHSP